MFSFILLFFAAIINAFMDTIDEHYDISIFRNYDRRFWSKNDSSDKAKKIFGYKLDAWHLSKSLFIIVICIIPFVYQTMISPVTDFLLMGSIWNVTFSLFYKNIFK